MFELFNDTLHYLARDWWKVALACAVSVAAHWILLKILSRLAVHRRSEDDLYQVQAAHTVPTPRVGGICIAILLTSFFLFVPPAARTNFTSIFLCMLPVLAVGASEDLGYRIQPLERLFATMFAAVLALYFLQTWIFRTGIPYIDVAWELAPVGIVGTVILVALLVHALNLIDGANGLATVFSILGALVLAEMADGLGGPAMTRLMRFLAIILVGFLVFNWPKPRVFLGDTGPYILGFVFAWSCILFLNRFRDISIFALGLVFLWPIAETCLAIVRRLLRGRSIISPDFMHTHQVVMRGLQVVFFGGRAHGAANSLVVVLLAPFMLAPMLAGLYAYRDARLSFTLFLLFLVIYFLSYVAMIAVVRRSRRWRIRRAPTQCK